MFFENEKWTADQFVYLLGFAVDLALPFTGVAYTVHWYFMYLIDVTKNTIAPFDRG